MHEEAPTKELIFVFSAKAAEEYGNHIAFDDDGRLFAYTAAFRQESVKRADWGDEVHVKTLHMPVDESVRQVIEHGQPVNRDQWRNWVEPYEIG